MVASASLPPLLTSIRSASSRERKQYPIGPLVPLSYSCRSTQPTGTLRVSRSNLWLPPWREKASASGKLNLFCTAFVATVSSWVNGPNISDWSFWSFLLKGTAMAEKLRTNCLNTVYNPREDLSSVTFVRSFKLLIASDDVWEAISMRLGLITCPN